MNINTILSITIAIIVVNIYKNQYIERGFLCIIYISIFFLSNFDYILITPFTK